MSAVGGEPDICLRVGTEILIESRLVQNDPEPVGSEIFYDDGARLRRELKYPRTRPITKLKIHDNIYVEYSVLVANDARVRFLSSGSI